jgi:hypothetical protein
MSGTNPNNCSTCDHKKTPQGGWCYMFKHEPVAICPHHTVLANASLTFIQCFPKNSCGPNDHDFSTDKDGIVTSSSACKRCGMSFTAWAFMEAP